YFSAHPPDLDVHSFPTRRSSDLSSSSNTPSANLLKKRGIPFSRTLPLTLKIFASGSTLSARGRRSCSVPPVPCNNSNVGLDESFPFWKICFMINSPLLYYFRRLFLLFLFTFFYMFPNLFWFLYGKNVTDFSHH